MEANKQQKPLKKKLTLKERKLAAAKVKDLDNLAAYEAAGYKLSGNKNVDSVNASRTINKPHIQAAIDAALELHGATPEWAVSQLMKVAAQDEELGAKRLASKDIIELHGWNKADRPTVQLQIKNGFFQGGRDIKKPENREENTQDAQEVQEAEIIDVDTQDVQAEQ